MSQCWVPSASSAVMFDSSLNRMALPIASPGMYIEGVFSHGVFPLTTDPSMSSQRKTTGKTSLPFPNVGKV